MFTIELIVPIITFEKLISASFSSLVSPKLYKIYGIFYILYAWGYSIFCYFFDLNWLLIKDDNSSKFVIQKLSFKKLVYLKFNILFLYIKRFEYSFNLMNFLL